MIGMLLFTAGLVLWLLVPLYDGSAASGRRRSAPRGSDGSSWGCSW